MHVNNNFYAITAVILDRFSIVLTFSLMDYTFWYGFIFNVGVCRYEERDVFMSRENLQELMDRLGTPPPLPLPLVFIHGQILGVSHSIMIGHDREVG